LCHHAHALSVQLEAEKSEKESLQSRMWGLQRNIKILQSERDVLEDKLRDCITTFAGLRKSMAQVGLKQTHAYLQDITQVE